MSSDQIRTASNETLRNITWGLVRGNTDNFSKQIAYGELEKRGLIRARF